MDGLLVSLRVSHRSLSVMHLLIVSDRSALYSGTEVLMGFVFGQAESGGVKLYFSKTSYFAVN